MKQCAPPYKPAENVRTPETNKKEVSPALILSMIGFSRQDLSHKPPSASPRPLFQPLHKGLFRFY